MVSEPNRDELLWFFNDIARGAVICGSKPDRTTNEPLL
jgi:hypothetical protein